MGYSMHRLFLVSVVLLACGCSHLSDQRDRDLAFYSQGYVDGITAAHSGAKVIALPPSRD